MEFKLKALVIGLGSMGKRRVRNLQHIGGIEVFGFDLREDRRNEATEKYAIQTFSSFEHAVTNENFDIFMISTSPKHHMEYAYKALEMSISCFIEASVVESDKIKRLHELSLDKDIVFAPSCTMRFFEGPKLVKKLITDKKIGDVVYFNYHTGQYLADWHPWEDIQDFYVSDRETGGAREIVPFEMTWINDIFGSPIVKASHYLNTGVVNADIDDLYTMLLDYDGIVGNMTVEVISRGRANRYLKVLGTEGQILFDGDSSCIKYLGRNESEWNLIELGRGNVEEGYINPENPYIEEVEAFLNAVRNKNSSLFPNSLLDDYEILKSLNDVEGARVDG